jgi:hypothetical protein
MESGDEYNEDYGGENEYSEDDGEYLDDDENAEADDDPIMASDAIKEVCFVFAHCVYSPSNSVPGGS